MPISYNPRDYVADYSWVGQVGDKISQLSRRIPSLIKLSREIEQNNQMKEQTRQAFFEYIGNMPEDMVMDIGRAMKLEANDQMGMRKELQKMVPNFSEDTSNRDYAQKVVTDFWNPMASAAKNGTINKYGYEDLMSVSLKSGEGLIAIQQLPDVARDLQVQQDVARQQAVGDVQVEQRVEQAEQMLDVESQQRQQVRQEQEDQAIRKSNSLSQIMREAGSSSDVWKSNYDNIPDDIRLKAYENIRLKELQDDQKILNDARVNAQKVKDKLVSEDILNNDINAIEGRITQLMREEAKVQSSDDITGITKKQMLKRIKSRIINLEDRQDQLQKQQRKFAELGGKTEQDLGRAGNIIAQQKQLEKYEKAEELISALKRGDIKGNFNWLFGINRSDKDEKRNFEKMFFDEFGFDIQKNDKGDYINPFSGSPDLIKQPENNIDPNLKREAVNWLNDKGIPVTPETIKRVVDRLRGN